MSIRTEWVTLPPDIWYEAEATPVGVAERVLAVQITAESIDYVLVLGSDGLKVHDHGVYVNGRRPVARSYEQWPEMEALVSDAVMGMAVEPPADQMVPEHPEPRVKARA